MSTQTQSEGGSWGTALHPVTPPPPAPPPPPVSFKSFGEDRTQARCQVILWKEEPPGAEGSLFRGGESRARQTSEPALDSGDGVPSPKAHHLHSPKALPKTCVTSTGHQRGECCQTLTAATAPPPYWVRVSCLHSQPAHTHRHLPVSQYNDPGSLLCTAFLLHKQTQAKWHFLGCRHNCCQDTANTIQRVNRI